AGPFASMRHDHSFRALASGVTEMKDVFMFRAPLGLLGRVAEYAVLRRHMRSLLRERNLVIQQRAEELP
ncbi:MAG TPA: cell division protein, partial [Bryobacteraceae bacterium]|nr:cell division protein [Bryobacteraceae bacterium]